jgi:very-short-patch-repair endonuclease
MSTAFARELRKAMTDAERKLWLGLRMRQLHGHKFRRQFAIGAYIVDFVCLDARLIVEVDGGQHAEEVYGDTARDAWLKFQNFRVLRYWNNQVLQELDAVMADIAGALEAGVVAKSPPSQSSPARGEGE